MEVAREEIALYLHKFHNLDLLSQGWYQIKVNTRWEGSEGIGGFGVPSRVLQYEVPDSSSSDTVSTWKISNEDNSFSTHPFKIKYKREDVYLSVLVSFSLNITSLETLLTKGVVLRFELLHASTDSIGLEASTLEFSSTLAHEVLLPPKALVGLHSYCPLYFDTFHSVLVELSVHVTLQKGATIHELSLSRGNKEGVASNDHEEEISDNKLNAEDIPLLKALCASQNILVDKLEKIVEENSHRIDDSEFPQKLNMNSLMRKITKHFEPNFVCASEDKIAEEQILSCTESGSTSLKSLQKQGNALTDGKGDSEWSKFSKSDIEKAVKLLGDEISFLWTSFLNYHRKYRVEIFHYLHQLWVDSRPIEWSFWFVHPMEPRKSDTSCEDALDDSSFNRYASEPWTIVPGADPASTAATCADLHRKSIDQMLFNTCSLQDLQIFGCPSQNPITFVEHHIILSQKVSHGNLLHVDNVTLTKSLKLSLPPKTADPTLCKRALRVVVFVHGFQGHHLDLRLVRNQWLLIDPGAEFLMSRRNEGRTTCDFKEMGKRLAEEVASFLKEKFYAGLKNPYGSFRLSFVGHSIGNIIIRAALADAAMKPYLNNLYTFMSIAGPHLGYLYSSNTLFSSGLWLFKKLQGSPFMHQLTFTDDSNLENCYLFKLSQEKNFEYFQNVILLSSPQDGYVPYHSARIKMCLAAERDSKRGPSYRAMIKNCIDQITLPADVDRTFLRFDVNFDHSTQAGSFNNFIGRTAHIEFLDTCMYAKFIMWSFPKLFS